MLTSALTDHPQQAEFSSQAIEVLLRLSHVTVLGRPVYFAKSLSQRVQELIRRSLLHAILRFEARGLAAAVELAMLVDNTRLAHAMLCEAGAVMQDFDSIWGEVNDAIDVSSFSSRLLKFCLAELQMDLLPNTVYHSVSGTFLRPPFVYVDACTRDEEKTELKKFEEANFKDATDRSMHLFGSKELSKALVRFVGGEEGDVVFALQHASALVSVLGHQSLPLLLQFCQERAAEVMQLLVIPYVQKTKNGVDKDLKLHKPELYTIDGVMMYFMKKFADLNQYDELHNGVLQAFREIGNIMCFATLLDRALSLARAQSSLHLSPLLAGKGGNAADLLSKSVRDVWGREADFLVAEAARTCTSLVKSGSLLQAVISKVRLLAV